jgi:hypothetical protein
MPVLKVEKPQADRISECVTILKKITDEVGIDPLNPSIIVLKKRMATYWRDGKLQEGTLPLLGYNRIILHRFPKWANQEVEVTLRVSNIKHPQLPSDLEAEVTARTSSATRSDPSGPSPRESEEK